MSDFTQRIIRKNTKNQTELPLTISSKDGLVDQVTYFNKKVSSKDMSGYYLLMHGEFAYNKSYSVGYDFGSIKRLDRYPMGALSTLYICFALTRHNSDFMKVYFDSLKWYKEIYMIAAEGARNHGLLNVPTDEFFATQHILPQSVDEQIKIAKFLTLIEQRIEKQQRLVENLKSYKRGLLSLVFSDKKSTHILEDILQKGKAGGTPQSSNATYYNGDIPFLSIADMTEQGKYIYSTEKHISEVGLQNSTAWIVPNNSLILSMYASYGLVAINKVPLATSQAMFNMIFEPNANVEYIYYYLTYLATTDYYTKMVSTGTQPNLNAEKVRAIPLYIPSRNEQKYIVALLQSYDNRLTEEEKILTQLQTLKVALLQQLFI
ncbi:MAG: restriction endonuclease subunit S [Muribaculaceae bacterium]|nr:restriction endonuclease subunit S [Muribaculaceae bacterium]